MALAQTLATPRAGALRARGFASVEQLAAIKTGVVDSMPVIAGIVPLALVIGVAIGESSVNNAAGWAGSLLIYAGSAHLAAISLMDSGAGMAAVLITVLVINARLLVYSASLGPRFQNQPAWFRWIGPSFLVDQLFALVWKRLEAGASAEWIRWYYLTIAFVVGAFWLPTMAIGVFAGPIIPSGAELSFATPVLLLVLLMPAMTDRATSVAAAVGAVVAVACIGMPNGMHLLLGAGAGVVAGLATERIGR
jgi:4-azaleucine resistance transporter AzlC